MNSNALAFASVTRAGKRNPAQAVAQAVTPAVTPAAGVDVLI